MRINDTRGPQGDASVGGASQPKKAGHAHGASEGATEVGARDSVKVKLPARARELSDQSSVDTAKVDRLKAQIASGDFKVNARAIAQKLVGEDE